MKKLIQKGLIVLLGVTLAVIVVYFLTLSKTELNFANDGTILCYGQKSWGFFSKGNWTCKGLVNIVAEPTPTPKLEKVSPSGEIILSK